MDFKMAADETSSVAALAVSVQDLRRITEVGFTHVEGELKLINQMIKPMEDHEKRLGIIESNYVTRRTVYSMVTLITLVVSSAGAIISLIVSR